MELNNDISKQAYIRLLIDTLNKKLSVLNNLTEITKGQEMLMDETSFDDNRFNGTITMKEEQLVILANLDHGFEQLYERARDELMNNKFRYMQEIAILKELITSITDMSVKLKAMEMRNKSKLEVLLAKKRNDLKDSMISSRTAAKYYKSMTQQMEEQSYFYDKKK